MKYEINKEHLMKIAGMRSGVLLEIINQSPDIYEDETGSLVSINGAITLSRDALKEDDTFTPLFGYELLKDTVKTKAGARFIMNGCYYQNIEGIGVGCDIGRGFESFSKEEVENNPDWFKTFGQ